MKSNVLKNFVAMMTLATTIGGENTSNIRSIPNGNVCKTPLTNKQKNLRNKNKAARKARARNRK